MLASSSYLGQMVLEKQCWEFASILSFEYGLRMLLTFVQNIIHDEIMTNTAQKIHI
jgi:hypothetical protein